MPLVIYNNVTGAVTLVNSGTNFFPNLDSVGLALENTGGTQGILPNFTGYQFTNDSWQWSENTQGTDVLPSGTYSLGTLPVGLGNSAFGSPGEGGVGNTDGSVWFYNASGGLTTTSVEVVPEPSSLALCAAAAAAAAVGLWRRTRKVRNAKQDAANALNA